MEHGNLGLKPRLEACQGLWRESDLWNQHHDLLAPSQAAGNQLQVHLGLAGPGDALQQMTLKLAQGRLLGKLTGSPCTYLVDDLPSELDKEHCSQVCQQLDALRAQVFITCVEAEDIASVWPSASSLTMFHVEHGSISGPGKH